MSAPDDELMGEKERLIQQIAELTPVVITVFDLDTEHDYYISPDVVNMHGYTPHELAQMKDLFSELVHPEDVARVREYFARLKAAADGEVRVIEYRLRHRSGEWRWLMSRHMPFARNEQGEVRQVVTASLDVTERKRAEEELRQSEERYRSYFELGLIGMAITSPTKGVIEVNDELCKILGYARRDLLQKTWAELTHPDDLSADLTRFDRVMAGEIEGYSIDKRWIRKDGQIIDATISVKALRRADGSVDYFVALVQDITVRKFAEEALRRAHEELEQRVVIRTEQLMAINVKLIEEIIERQRAEEELRRSEAYLTDGQRLSHTGNGAWNVSTGEAFWSEETYRIYGYDPETKPSYELFLQILHPEDRLRVEQSFERVVRERSDYEMEFRIIRPVGNVRHIYSVGRPVLNEAGELTEVIGTVMDITERKRAEEERGQLLRRIVFTQEEERHRIARDMHDQMGQQLSALILKLAIMKENCREQPELCEEIEQLQGVARQLDRDIDFLVWELRPGGLDDLGLVAVLSHYVQSWSRRFGIVAELHTSGMEADGMTAEVETTLYRVTQEALNNVAKHAGARNVGILLERRAAYVSLIIEDDGKGFDGEQGLGEGEKGLGLIGMRERTAVVGGTLEIESYPGGGATVVLRIPLPQDPHEEARHE
ncbi:MAG TPA: PAS domain S-box protein [Pyrinomonadaceae bacterium]|jgi:PAS domain S-box-containing protein